MNVFNHASTAFGDVVWTGQSTRHIRQGMEAVITQEELRRVWMCISPIVYFNKFERWPKKSLMIYGRYDLTFLPEFSVQTAGEFLRRGLDTTIKALPCGHYSLGETPYKYMDAPVELLQQKFVPSVPANVLLRGLRPATGATKERTIISKPLQIVRFIILSACASRIASA